MLFNPESFGSRFSYFISHAHTYDFKFNAKALTISDINDFETEKPSVTTCGNISVVEVKIGDVDGNGIINSRDAIHLLYHIFFPNDYTVNQDCDFDGNGVLNSRDAIYLLYHIFFPNNYPI
ncbi:MAG: dockerin type I repeat-containing protein [Clostridia bacterium]|nr:dockerin type I repeat-containing protein [Clostridia bacterium]